MPLTNPNPVRFPRIRRAWAAVRATIAWFRFHVLLEGREIPTKWAERHLRFLRMTAYAFGGGFALLGAILWYNLGVARASALRILVERQQAQAYLAMKTYEQGRTQVRGLMDKVDQDQTISDAERIQRKGDLATIMLWLLARENATMRVYGAAARAHASIPHRVSGETPIVDPVSGMPFPLAADEEAMKPPMIAMLQQGDQATAFIHLVGIYSQRGAPAMPSETGVLLDSQAPAPIPAPTHGEGGRP